MPGIGLNIILCKNSSERGHRFDVRCQQTKAGGGGITLQFRLENDNFYSFKLDLNEDGYTGKEPAMNAATNAQVWRRRLGDLNKRSLELINRKYGKGVAFDGSIADCDVCAVVKSHHLAHPKKANHVAINAPFQLLYGHVMGPSKPTAYGGYMSVSKIADQFTKWTAVYLLCSKYQALALLQLFVTLIVIPLAERIICWRAYTGDDFTGDEFKEYCL